MEIEYGDYLLNQGFNRAVVQKHTCYRYNKLKDVLKNIANYLKDYGHEIWT